MVLKRRPPAGNSRRVRSTGRNIIGTMTNKAGRIVQFESHAEHMELLRLDRKRCVRDFATQPEPVEWIDERGRVRRYTPDIIVWYVDGSVEVIEVTRSERRNLAVALHLAASHGRALSSDQVDKICAGVERALRREDEARRFYANKGWIYTVLTEHELPSETEAANLLTLCRYRPSCYADTRATVVVMRHIANGDRPSLHDIVARVSEEMSLAPGVVCGAIYHLIWHGRLHIDMQRLLLRDAEPAPGVVIWVADR